MDPDKARVLAKQLGALKAYVRNVAQIGTSLDDNATANQYRRIYEHIEKTLADPDLKIYAPNISYWISSGSDRRLWPEHHAEIVSSGTRLIAYLEEAIREAEPKQPKPAAPRSTTRIFISHGRPSPALESLKEFVRALGLEPIVVMEQASRGMSLDSKVVTSLKDCVAAVILATGDDRVEGGSRFQPRQNVIHEVGLAQQVLAGRLIYLLEVETEFPSNIAPKVYERFTDGDMTRAFIAVVRDLRAFGVLA